MPRHRTSLAHTAGLFPLAGFLARHGRYAEAEGHYREALGIRATRLPSTSLQVANSRSLLGDVLIARKRYRCFPPYGGLKAGPSLRGAVHGLIRQRSHSTETTHDAFASTTRGPAPRWASVRRRPARPTAGR